MKLNTDSTLTFGKYITKQLKDILESDPAYILWLDDHTDNVISNTLYKAALKGVKYRQESRDVWFDS